MRQIFRGKAAVHVGQRAETSGGGGGSLIRVRNTQKMGAANGRRDLTLNWLPSNVLVSANERRLYPADIYPLSRGRRGYVKRRANTRPRAHEAPRRGAARL